MFNVDHNSVFHNKRVDNTLDSSLGILKLDGYNIGFVVEDEPRVDKLVNETRILANMYELKINENLTPLTIKYRKKFDWFKNHIELIGVFNFTGIYVHIGNFESNTSGCQIIGRDASPILEKNGEWRNKYSTDLYKEFYLSVYPVLKEGKRVFWKITDN